MRQFQYLMPCGEWDVFTQREKSSFFFHLFVAFLFIPLYLSPASSIVGLAVAPYIFFMVFNPKREYLLPLIVHTFWGSQQRYLMLFACFLYCFYRINSLKRYGLLGIFLFYASIFPFFVWYTYARYRVFGGGIGAGGTFNGIGYYLAFAPFFWAVLSDMRITRETFLWMLFIGLLLVVSASFVKFCRASVWGMLMLPAVLCWFFWSCRKSLSRHNMPFCAVLILLIGCVFFTAGFLSIFGARVTFTMFGVLVVSLFYILAAKKSKIMIRHFTPYIFFALSAMGVWHAIATHERGAEIRAQYRYSGIGMQGYDEVKIRDFKTLKEKVLRKIYTDRAPLWTAAWDGFIKQCKKNPIFVDPLPIYGEVDLGDRVVEIDLMAHNIMLLLLQEFGLWGGLGLYIIYMMLFSKKEIRETISRDFCTPYAPIGALCLGHAVMGGYAGQYVMNAEFSFLLYSMLGCVFSRYYEHKACVPLPM